MERSHRTILIQLFCTCVLALLSFSVDAQKALCHGSLGENIFTEGDFGSGRDNIYQSDPGLAPGYIYTTQTPIPDGFYTITNDMARWYDNWPTWLPIRDNSDDRYGYMMVVNASYEPGVFYDQIVDGVCGGTLYEFSADVINLISRRTRDHLYPNVSFLIDGVERYNTGKIKQTEEWQTVGFSFRTERRQEQIRLTLRNNAPGGVGNDIALDNISFRACGPVAYIVSNSPDVICQKEFQPTLNAFIDQGGDRYIQWQISRDDGETWYSPDVGNSSSLKLLEPLPGRTLYRFLHAASESSLSSEKCRAISDVYELMVLPSEYVIDRKIDAGQYVVFGGEEIRESGTYQLALQSSSGCDSFVTLNLVVEGAPPTPAVPLAIALETSESKVCPEVKTGFIRATGSGGVPPYSYKWSNGATTSEIRDLGSGTYMMTLTDAQGREQISEVIIPSFSDVEAAIGEIRPASRNGPGDGRAEVEVADSLITGLSFQWDNGETGQYASALIPGRHSVTITNESGCQLVLSAEVPAKLIPTLTAEMLSSGEAVRIEKLQFDADSSSIKPQSIPVLDELYLFLYDNPAIVIEIGGHTNGLPDHVYCDKLSKARAKSVAEWIVDRGIAEERVYYKGYGKRNPIATNSTVQGRMKNQRVEVRVVEVAGQD